MTRDDVKLVLANYLCEEDVISSLEDYIWMSIKDFENRGNLERVVDTVLRIVETGHE